MGSKGLLVLSRGEDFGSLWLGGLKRARCLDFSPRNNMFLLVDYCSRRFAFMGGWVGQLF